MEFHSAIKSWLLGLTQSLPCPIATVVLVSIGDALLDWLERLLAESIWAEGKWFMRQLSLFLAVILLQLLSDVAIQLLPRSLVADHVAVAPAQAVDLDRL